MTLRAALVFSAACSLFFFPAPLSLMLALAATVLSPLSALLLGVLADLLYFAPGAHPFFFYTLLGVGLATLSFLVRKFAKTSIMH